MAPRSKQKGKPKKFRPRIEERVLGRRKPFLTTGKSVLIVCEDSKSSCFYFDKFRKKLRLSTVQVEICGKECGSAPISVVDCAIEKKKLVEISSIRDEYDIIFCVIDVDTHPTLSAAMGKASDNGLKVILSNPCVEFWYILHFKYIGGAFNSSKKVVSQLKKFYPQYDKGSDKFFEAICNQTDMAIENSKQIIQSQWQDETDPVKCNPSTYVHEVVECLREISKESN